MQDLGESYEVIFIDDGSTDGSFEILKGLHQKDSNAKVIRFTRDFGQHIAITAGFDDCKGENVIVMDGDLQDQPEEIHVKQNPFSSAALIVRIGKLS